MYKIFNRRQITVAINLYPPKGPWGGAGFFVQQVENGLKQRGIRVQYHLRGKVNLILLIDPREDLENKAFGMEEIKRYKAAHPDVRLLHRINECDARKNSSFIDRLLEEANQEADHTVFISSWLRDHHSALWYDIRRPHSVIYNGADPCLFNPLGKQYYSSDRPLRLVTHHWSDNAMKGFVEYKLIDEFIHQGLLKDVEFWVIGRWPQSIQWKAAKTFPPVTGKKLANLLRQCDLYVTASRWEPCGMHHVEGAQCGLPLLYHEDGGGIVEAGQEYGIGFRDDLVLAIEKMKGSYNDYLSRVLYNMPCGDRMQLDYIQLIQTMICSPSCRD